jgi:hypothetical protein
MDSVIKDFILPRVEKECIDEKSYKDTSKELIDLAFKLKGDKCISLLKQLIDKGILTENLLYLSVKYGKYDVMKMLVDEYKMDVNYSGIENNILHNPLYMMLSDKKFDGAEYLIKNGANVNKQLSHTCYYDDFYIRCHGRNKAHRYMRFNEESAIRTYILIEMIQNDNHEAVKFLLENGANTNVYCESEDGKKRIYLDKIAKKIHNPIIIELFKSYKVL